MKMNTTVNRYIFKEFLGPFSLNVFFFTFIFLLAAILEITKMIVNYKISLSSVLMLMVYKMPSFLIFIIPMSIMLAVLLTFLRMSSDNEIIALKASGISIYQILPSVFLFCLAGCLLTGFMSIHGMPWGRISFKKLTISVISSNLDIGLKERTFNDNFKNVMLYVNKVDLKSKTLIDVFIEDRRNKNAVITVIAPKGKLSSNAEKGLFHLRLSNGFINQVDTDDRRANSIRFETYDIQLDIEKALVRSRNRPKDEKEMTLSELNDSLKNAKKKDGRYYESLIEFHKKFSIPFSCFTLGLLAVPLGIHSSTAKRTFGLGLGLFFFLFYYLLLSAGIVFGETGKYPPIIGMWVPNIITGITAMIFLVKSVRGRLVYFQLPAGLLKLFGSRFNNLSDK